MKSIFAVLTLFLLCSCDKDETTGPTVDPPKEIACEISSQSGFASDEKHSPLVPYGGGFKKIYSHSKVARLELLSYNWYFEIDSFFYDISYHGKSATVTATNQKYEREGEFELIPTTRNVFTFEVSFNDNGFATQAGSRTIKYDNDRLVGMDSISITYDDSSNIIAIKDGGRELNYTYDLSRSAKNQIYVTSGAWISGTYNFLEVMGWIPVAPHNLRTSHALVTWEDFDEDGQDFEKEIWETLLFSDHLVQDGVLVSFVVQNDIPDGLIRTISNEIKCTD
jgi:hypothetical protein